MIRVKPIFMRSGCGRSADEHSAVATTNVGELALHERYHYEIRFDRGKFFDPMNGRTPSNSVEFGRNAGACA